MYGSYIDDIIINSKEEEICSCDIEIFFEKVRDMWEDFLYNSALSEVFESSPI